MTRLTPREAEALALIGEGLTTREVAQRLGVAERTAKEYGDKLRRKFNVQHRRELIPIAKRTDV